MILLYTSLLLVLGVAAFLIQRRAARLGRKYVLAAAEADKLLQQSFLKQGNAGRCDPFLNAKRQYLLGEVVDKRDQLEARYDYWRKLAKRSSDLIASLRAWRGRKLPYTLGVVDVSLALYLVDELSVGQYMSVKQLVNLATSYFTG